MEVSMEVKKVTLSKLELREKLERLLRREEELRKDRKNAVKVYDIELVDIKKELKQTLLDIDSLNVA